MVTLTIDQKHIQVAEGTTILEAAEQNGIPIPRLCYLNPHARSWHHHE